jgi:hypothetical protein
VQRASRYDLVRALGPRYAHVGRLEKGRLFLACFIGTFIGCVAFLSLSGVANIRASYIAVAVGYFWALISDIPHLFEDQLITSSGDAPDSWPDSWGRARAEVRHRARIFVKWDIAGLVADLFGVLAAITLHFVINGPLPLI